MKPNRAWRGLNKLMVRLLPPSLLFGRPIELDTMVLGEGDGSWRVPRSLPSPNPVCYCVGVGMDASFDRQLAEVLKAEVHSFDPTPTSVAYMRDAPDGVAFHPWGVWDDDTELPMYHQDPGDAVNLSVINPGASRGGRQVTAEFLRLQTIMRHLGHTHIDLLKIDVEGAWWRILRDMCACGIVPGVLCVEFDSPTSVLRVFRMGRLLRRAGMRFVSRSRDDYLFVQG